MREKYHRHQQKNVDPFFAIFLWNWDINFKSHDAANSFPLYRKWLQEIKPPFLRHKAADVELTVGHNVGYGRLYVRINWLNNLFVIPLANFVAFYLYDLSYDWLSQIEKSKFLFSAKAEHTSRNNCQRALIVN